MTAAANRATRISKLQTLLKKAYKPTITTEDRSLVEHLLYACLLENAPYELADEALARLEQDYFDWNEVRVTTITELSEVLSRLPDPTAAAIRLKKNLHGLFESLYTFDLEELKKQNLGKALQKFERLPAMTPFVLAYVTQHGLGGHAIPLDSAALRFFWLADIITESELKASRVTGLERAVPKNKGLEFASLLHQAAVALNLDPADSVAREIVLTLNPQLDQKVADHVAAVKKRRVARAKAKAAEELEVQEAEAKRLAKPSGKGGAKSASSKTSGGKTSGGKTSGKVSAKKGPAPANQAAPDAAVSAAASSVAATPGKSLDATAPKKKSSKSKTEAAAAKNRSETKGSETKGADKKGTDKKGTDKKGTDKKGTDKKAAADKNSSPGKKTAGPASPPADAGTAAARSEGAADAKTGKKISKRKPR